MSNWVSITYPPGASLIGLNHCQGLLHQRLRLNMLSDLQLKHSKHLNTNNIFHGTPLQGSCLQNGWISSFFFFFFNVPTPSVWSPRQEETTKDLCFLLSSASKDQNKTDKSVTTVLTVTRNTHIGLHIKCDKNARLILEFMYETGDDWWPHPLPN